MNNPYQARVGQKLLHANKMLDMAGQVNLQGPDRQKHIALTEAALFHLIMARDFYTLECLHRYKMTVSGVVSLDQAVERCLEQGKTCPELKELQAIASDAYSWSAGLTHQYQSITSGVITSTEENQPLATDISLTNLDSRSAKFELSHLQLWYKEFSAVLERQRETSLEW